jgi:hypothetical protein
MSSRNLFASILMTCMPVVGLLGMVPAANAASAGAAFLNPGKNVRASVVQIKNRDRGPRIYPPIAPSYLYYDQSFGACRCRCLSYLGCAVRVGSSAEAFEVTPER